MYYSTQMQVLERHFQCHSDGRPFLCPSTAFIFTLYHIQTPGANVSPEVYVFKKNKIFCDQREIGKISFSRHPMQTSQQSVAGVDLHFQPFSSMSTVLGLQYLTTDAFS